jgi:CheY-like chemotaxis protein
VEDGVRVLVASALGRLLGPVLTEALPHATVVVATDPTVVHRAIVGRVRFDAVVADLIWMDPAYEYDFDGLDVLKLLRDSNRSAPMIMALHGHGIERDHLEEAITQPDVVGVVQKAAGFGPPVEAVQIAAAGRLLPKTKFPIGQRLICPSLDSYFSRGRRGHTAACLAGAIAAGQATDYQSLAAATCMPLNTVNKLVSYLGPLIEARREHAPELPLNSQEVYRWCGEHSRYIISWRRRHGSRSGWTAPAPS